MSVMRRISLVTLGLLLAGCPPEEEFVGYWNDRSPSYDGGFVSDLYWSIDIVLVDEETQAYELTGFWAYTEDETERDSEPKTWLSRGRWSGSGLIDANGRLPVTGDLTDCSGSPIGTLATDFPFSYDPAFCLPFWGCFAEQLFGTLTFDSQELAIEHQPRSFHDQLGRNDDMHMDSDFCPAI